MKQGLWETPASGKIKSFTDLNAWREGHRLVVDVYKFTKLFPREESFGLTSQMRRASVSVTSNLAEGFSRRSSKDKSHFYSMAHGSLTEIQNQLFVARDVGYIDGKCYSKCSEQAVLVHKLITGLIKSTKTENYRDS